MLADATWSGTRADAAPSAAAPMRPAKTMKTNQALLALLACLPFAACSSPPPAAEWASVQRELAQRVAEDQRLRRELHVEGLTDMRVIEQLSAVDAANTAWLKGLVHRSGWPTTAHVGEQGARDAWLLVQHADRDVDFQERCVGLLREAVARGQGSPKHLAYLEDRVALHRERPQRYGTQFVPTSIGMAPYRLEDPARVDAWRAEIGLEPLAEYAARLRGEKP